MKNLTILIIMPLIYTTFYICQVKVFAFLNGGYGRIRTFKAHWLSTNGVFQFQPNHIPILNIINLCLLRLNETNKMAPPFGIEPNCPDFQSSALTTIA